MLEKLAQQKISIRVASPKLVMEEAPESYKDVTAVVDTCSFAPRSLVGPDDVSAGHAAGISRKCVKLRPIAVIKG